MMTGNLYGAYSKFRINATKETVCFGEDATGGPITFVAGTIVYQYMEDGVIKHSLTLPAESTLFEECNVLIPQDDVDGSACVPTYIIMYRS